jgi:cell division inhibitor SepF
MAGAMRKMAVYLGLVEDDDRYDDYDDYDEPEDGDGRGADRHGVDRNGADRNTLDRADRHGVDRHGVDRQIGDRQIGDRQIGDRHGVGTLREERGSVATLPERRPTAVAPAQRGSLDRITTIHPRTYNEAKQIGESFRSGTPVIMNLTDMDDADAKRLVDFAAGLVFGLHGTIERVTAKVFLLSPANVSVTAEDKARMAESGFFNQS